MKIYAFIYNPMVEESGYITVSLHKTKKGAEEALKKHKAERLKEWEAQDKERRARWGDDYEVLSNGLNFGVFEDWDIEEREVLD